MCFEQKNLIYEEFLIVNNPNRSVQNIRKRCVGKFYQYGPGPLLGFNHPHLETHGER